MKIVSGIFIIFLFYYNFFAELFFKLVRADWAGPTAVEAKSASGSGSSIDSKESGAGTAARSGKGGAACWFGWASAQSALKLFAKK